MKNKKTSHRAPSPTPLLHVQPEKDPTPPAGNCRDLAVWLLLRALSSGGVVWVGYKRDKARSDLSILCDT